MADRLASLTFGKCIIVGALLAAGYYFFMYDPGTNLRTTLVTANSELEKNRKEVQSINVAIKDAERFQKTMSFLGEEMEKILKAMPSKLTAIELMKIISNEAKGVGVEINKLNSPQNAQVKGFTALNKDASIFYEPVSVDIELTGNYNQIMLFMSNLTRLDKIVTARKLKVYIGESAKKSSNPDIKLNASLQAYRYISEPPPDPRAKKPVTAPKGAVKK